jgi:hypothetical protein
MAAVVVMVAVVAVDTAKVVVVVVATMMFVPVDVGPARTLASSDNSLQPTFPVAATLKPAMIFSAAPTNLHARSLSAG